MVSPEFMEKIRHLPARQQVAIWVILREFHTPKGTWFNVADFATKAERYLRTDETDGGRAMGGLLSSLVRNGILTQLAGGRKPVWQVVPELHKNAKEYADAIHPTVTYWETS